MSAPVNRRTPEQKALAEQRLAAAKRRLSAAEDPQTHGEPNLVLHNVENPHPHYQNHLNIRTPEQLALAKKRLAAAPVRQYANHNHAARNAAVCVPGNVGCMPGFKLFPNLGIYRTYKNWRARKAAQKRQAINSKPIIPSQPQVPTVEIPKHYLENKRTPQQRALAEARVRALNKTRKVNQAAGRRRYL